MNGLTQARAKLIRSLRQKKERDASGLFLVEGAKAVKECLVADWPVKTLLCTEDFLLKNAGLNFSGIPEVITCNEKILAGIGNFMSNNAALLVAEQMQPASQADPESPLWLAVDNLADPGNLGTLIRLADWFGLEEVICLGNVVEWYNPKVVAASMGSFLRVKQVRLSREGIFSAGRELLAADMEGDDLYHYKFPLKSTLLIGSEAAGLPDFWLNKASARISIPAFGKAESLNAAVAGGILLSHWKKQSISQ